MTPAQLLLDGLERVHGMTLAALDGIAPDAPTYRADPDANTVAWLVWHLTRVADDHVSELAGTEQVWTAQGFERRFGLPLPSADIGYGHDSTQVGTVRASAADLVDYHRATLEMVATYVGALSEADLDDVVDTSWDPPVTRGARLVSVLSDTLAHAGQAAYVRGLAERA